MSAVRRGGGTRVGSATDAAAPPRVVSTTGARLAAENRVGGWVCITPATLMVAR